MVLLAVAAGCSRESPEQAVRDRIESLQEAVDARDAGDVADMLADDFIGNDGLDKQGARQLAAGMFLRYRDVSAKLGPATVELRGARDAVATFSVLATGGSGGLLPDSGQVYEVETGWRLVDGEWKLLSAEWRPKL
ncbi:nuclear transport factor 2 family protein [Pseudoluteimonas lycopersici]|uniref:Nuclear transport factor 2 family protein n=1 Tax=Pseudoluteimonas lycopersici TaxID=1324796 RepID=A0A516V2X0_9GAMM|nr:nuclear transport factor 2 family protein [Lysobacter lycopersici]QDQ72878.1 nuclear transport factor 2 family protein [Lysobacter lycopersici]